MTKDQVRYVLQLEDLIMNAHRELRLSYGVGLPDLLGEGRHGDRAQEVIDGRERRHQQIDRGEIIIP